MCSWVMGRQKPLKWRQGTRSGTEDSVDDFPRTVDGNLWM